MRLHGGVCSVGAHALAAAGETEGLDLEGGHGRDHALVVGAVVRGRVEKLVRGLNHELRRPHRLRDLVVAGAPAVDLLIETVAARAITQWGRVVRPGESVVTQAGLRRLGMGGKRSGNITAQITCLC